MEPRSAHLDADRLRALAHPLRVQLLGALRIEGTATASQLADRLGTSSGMTSYHLRQLADAGLIEEVVDKGNARERWWRAAHDTTSFRPSEVTGGWTEAARWLQSEQGRVREREWSTWLAERDTWSDTWGDVADSSDYCFRLTADELESLLTVLHDVLRAELARTVDRRDGREPVPPEAEAVRLHMLAFPTREVAGYRLDRP